MAAIHTILVPTNFSDASRHAFTAAVELARVHGAAVIVLHAQPIRGLQTVPEGDHQVRLEAPDDPPATRQALADYQAPGLATPVEHWLIQGEPANVILWAARVAKSDLIVLGGQAAAERGDVARKVTNAAPCPVLIMEGPSQFSLHSSAPAPAEVSATQPCVACLA
jgi:nucleotide-binding universal stress UspA family protein